LPTKIREKKRRFYPADKNPRKKNAVSTLPIFVGDPENAFFQA
jgi:hypothetical protein